MPALYRRADAFLHLSRDEPFGIVYQTPVELCARIPEIVKEVVNGCEKCAFLRCGMVAYGASSLDYSFEFDVRSEVWQKVFDARSQVLIALLKRFNEEGIEFAYPTQTSFTAAPDGTIIMPYPDVQPVKRVDLTEEERS